MSYAAKLPSSRGRGALGGFAKAGTQVFRLDDITSADFSNIEQLAAVVRLRNGETFEAQGPDAIELAYAIKPSVLEGRRMAHARHAWAFHNLVAHPVMQILAFFKAYHRALWIHDSTVPKPLGAKPPRRQA